MLLNNLFNTSYNKLATGLFVLIALSIAGCGAGGGNTENKTGALTPASITISPATTSIVAKGKTSHFIATATYTDKSTADITSQVSWASSNTAVATIDNSNGVATGIAAGETTITASVSGISAPGTKLTVTAAEITGITITSSTQTTPKGLAVTYTATAAFSDNSSGNVSGAVSWVSSNATVATLNTSGIAASLAQGTTTITAISNGVTSNSVSLTVTAPELVTLSIKSPSPTIGYMKTLQFTASGILTDGTPAILNSLNWKSSIPATISIDGMGLAKGLSLGSSEIIVASNGINSNSITMSAIPSLLGGAIQGNALNLTTVVSTLAGVAADPYGASSHPLFNSPTYITTDGTNLYLSDSLNNKIRKIVIASGVVTTLAGSGVAGSADDTGNLASFNYPQGITTDGINLYVADNANNKIRKIVISSGVVTTLAGSGAAGVADDTGAMASFNYPKGITTDGTNLYIADSHNNKIRKIVIASSVVTTLAGSGVAGAADNTGILATFSSPTDITTDGTHLYLADTQNNKIRKIVIASGVVTTLAGSGASGAANNTGTLATFNHPEGITTDGSNLYIADTTNNIIRKIVLASGVVTTLAGKLIPNLWESDGTGMAAEFWAPLGITTDGSSLYVVDAGGDTVRKIK